MKPENNDIIDLDLQDIDNDEDSIIVKGLFLNQCLNEGHYDYVEELLADIIAEAEEKEEQE